MKDINKVEKKAVVKKINIKVKSADEYLKVVNKVYKKLWPGTPPEFGKDYGLEELKYRII